jgi:anaerobic selenocysteine-containing dehydrogenase
MIELPSPTTKTVRGACPHDCPDTCAWTVTVTNGEAVELRPDKEHPFTQGRLCAKVNHYLEDRVYSPQRLRYPLRRIGAKGNGRFERVSWDEALAEVAGRLQRIIAEVGPEAILPYSYMGTQGMVQGASLDRRFFAHLGASQLARTICGSTAGAGVAAALGTSVGTIPEEIVHSRLIILWGTNTMVTNLHLWPFIQKARANGATLVVIDPVTSRTAAQAEWHIRPLPGTDAALALGMMHVIVAEGLHDEAYLEKHALGFEQLQQRLAAYPPQRVAQITGVAAEEVVRLARAYATTAPATIRTLIGMEHHENGAMTLRTIACLPALVGAWRERGGGLLHTTAGLFYQALNIAALEMPQLIDPAARTINMVEIGKALTNPTLAPPIQALIVYNSNPAVIAPNQNLVHTGLRRDDLLIVVVEQFMTDTARYADYVFPATTQVEHHDLLWSWGHTYISLNRPAIQPVGEALPNTEFFRRLARHMGFTQSYLYESDESLIQSVLESNHPYARGIRYERLLAEGWAPLKLPDPWLPFAEGNFPTPSGKCEFYVASWRNAGLDPLPAYVPPQESVGGDAALVARYPLSLLTPKSTLHFLNSSYGHLPRHLQAAKEPLLIIHPDDARPRQIQDGEMVNVFNDRGTVQIRAAVDNRVRPGVVAIPFGWWPSFSSDGASANALTADGVSDKGSGGNFYDTLVDVQRSPYQ